MTLESNLTAFAQAVAGDVKALFESMGHIHKSVLKYGASANGVTDSSAAIAAAIAACPDGGTVYFPPGTYAINAPIVLGKPMTLRGSGATIRGGSSPTGALATEGCHIYVTSGDVIIDGLRFTTPITTITPQASPSAAIYIENAPRVKVTRCAFTGPGISGIIVTGPGSLSCEISDNTLTNVTDGIMYSVNGASYTRAVRNTIADAPLNAMSGWGNGATPNRGCLVASNIISNYGRVAIEDGTNCYETRVIGNQISGGGSVEQGIALSIVSVRPYIAENTVTDWVNDGIETTGSGATVLRNVLSQRAAGRKGTGTGIIVNNYTQSTKTGATVSHNVIEDASVGINAAQAPGTVLVNENTIIGGSRGVFADISDAETALHVVGNKVLFKDSLTSDDRAAFEMYSSAATGLRGCTVLNNHVRYVSPAANSSGGDWCVKILANDMTVAGNVFDGGGVATPQLGVSGATSSGAVVLNNRLLRGAELNIGSYPSVVSTGNVTTA